MDAPEPRRRWADLRRAAESRLRALRHDPPEAVFDQTQLIHELRVHQAELEMQNEELLSAQAENARSSVRYQRLYELAPVACVTVDRSGRVEESNLRAAVLFGVSHAEFHGRPMQKFMPELAADIFHRHLRSVFANSTRQTCRIVLERRGANPGPCPVRIESIAIPDETSRRMLCQSVLVNLSETADGPCTPENGMTPLLEAAVDAVVRSSAEAHLESLQDVAERLDSMRDERDFAERLLATLPATVLVLDLDGCVVRFNRCFEDLTGYRLEEVRGADWVRTFLPEEDHQRSRATFARLLREKVPARTTTPICTRHGNKVPVEWHHTLLRDTRACVCGYLSIGVEVARPPARER